MYNGGYIDLTLLLTERSVEECCQLLGCHHHHHLTLHLNKSKPPCFNSALFDSQNNRNCRDYVQSCSRTAQSSAPSVNYIRVRTLCEPSAVNYSVNSKCRDSGITDNYIQLVSFSVKIRSYK